jgi:glutathione S-transferase
MSIVLYDLVGIEDRRFSPNTWRSRLAIAHKGLDCEARATRFIDVPELCGGRYKTIPIIEDGDTTVCDSWAIADYLEQTYPDRPSLFGGDAGRALSVFVQAWVNTVVHPGVAKLIMLDLFEHVLPEDQDYFRQAREKRFGQTLEQVQAGREERVDGFRKTLHPLRLTLKEQPFLGGDAPLYADYLAFGGFQWARVVSPFRLLEDDDPIAAWLQRCLDLYDGLARNATRAYY